jgi:hypothetical protein
MRQSEFVAAGADKVGGARGRMVLTGARAGSCVKYRFKLYLKNKIKFYFK